MNFTSGRAEMQTIAQIANRAHAILTEAGHKADKIDLIMDISAANANGAPLDLDGLLNADRANFIHDVCGIVRHIDRTTGRLKEGFSPRYSARPKQVAPPAAT